MIGAIVLTLRRRAGVKRQTSRARSPRPAQGREGVETVSVKSPPGIDV